MEEDNLMQLTELFRTKAL